LTCNFTGMSGGAQGSWNDAREVTSQDLTPLLRGPQYALPQAEKEARLLPIVRALCVDMARRCPPYGRFLKRLGGDPDAWQTLADVPPLPVSVFKRFRLSAVPPEKVVRELHSSGTSGQEPARIVIDKTTAFRQARALASILREHVGASRRPLLVLDAAESVAEGEQLSARGAAIRGVANFATETVFGLLQLPDGELVPEWPRIERFFDDHGDGPLLLFGFTFIVWTRFVEEAERRGARFKVGRSSRPGPCRRPSSRHAPRRCSAARPAPSWTSTA